MSDALILPPASHFSGTITLPGAKSLANRALLLAALAQGTTVIDNLPAGEDVSYMLQALSALGVCCHGPEGGTSVEVVGGAGYFPNVPPGSPLFLGNAGTVMRPLAALLALDRWWDVSCHQDQTGTVITGIPRMQARPIGPLVDALRQGGAKIDYLGTLGYPPLRVHGGFQGGILTVDGTLSSQFTTALLMAAPLAKKDSVILLKGRLVSQPYIQMTLRLMRHFGVAVEQRGDRQFYLPGRQQYVAPPPLLLEGDAAAASYFLAAAAIKGGPVRVNGIGKYSQQGEAECVAILERMGAQITWGENYIECHRGALHGIDVDMGAQPDSAMTIATVALFAEGPSEIRNISHWRVKESDRLHTMAAQLRSVGATVEEGNDFIRIVPPAKLQAAKIDTCNDHRIAMCFSLVALGGVAVTLSNPLCVAKSFPHYFFEWQRLTACSTKP